MTWTPTGERYVDRELLGEGGMGSVRRVEDRLLGRTVARKSERADVVHPRFLREVQLQGQLEHPAVVPIYDVGVHPDGRSYFDMKEVRGVDLATVLERRREDPHEAAETWSLRRLLSALVQVCNAVHYAHQRGIVHLDLKPSNVMLGELGEVYVLDWGIARRLDEVLPTVEVQGTAGYVAPERIDGHDDHVTPRADVYALGATLFEIITDEPLHPGGTSDERWHSTLCPTEARIRELCREAAAPPELETLCVRATALSPAERMGSALELAHGLERFLDGDRDVTLRRRIAEELHAAARAALEHDRAAAAQLAGRALALDPGARAHQGLVAQLLLTPPRELPPEVAREEDAARIAEDRALGYHAALSYAACTVVLMITLLGPIYRLELVVACAAVGLVQTGLALFFARAPRPPGALLWVAMVLDGGIYFTASTYAGSALLVPALVVAASALYLRHSSIRRPRLFIAGILTPILGLFLLETLGPLRARFVAVPEGLVIGNDVAALDPTILWVLAVATTVTSVVVTAMASHRLATAQRAAERSLRLQRWHLAQLVPVESGA